MRRKRRRSGEEEEGEAEEERIALTRVLRARSVREHLMVR